VRPSAGVVRIDGEPLTAARARQWRASVAYVSQDTVLFHDSIRANLLWAQPDATEAALREALALAGAAAFVAALPDGLDTVVGDRGVLVSGGERQRIAIARALLRHPEVLILDEPTSALDSEHERRILDTLDGLRGRVTMILVTHRLGAVRQADVVHVLDGGRIIESGAWVALMAAPQGRFRQLADLQGVSA
jgi:ATP-binding cassette subfamily C protein